LIGDFLQEETALCQQTFKGLDQSHFKIAACASCCECLLSLDGQQVLIKMKIDSLPSAFLLTELQIQCLKTLPREIVENNIQAVKHNIVFYHMNPDVVFDVNKIVLCPVCAENLMTKDCESISAGNDYYGWLGLLKPPNGTIQNACVPVQLYNFNLQI
jgi:hypothetical protein